MNPIRLQLMLYLMDYGAQIIQSRCAVDWKDVLDRHWFCFVLLFVFVLFDRLGERAHDFGGRNFGIQQPACT